MRVRGFEKITKYQDVTFPMPVRKTTTSAGYDICVPEDVALLPNRLVMVPTGIKAYMQPDEFLGIHIRSSMAVKKSVRLVNNVGIIDADYYNNPDNEGHIMLALLNTGVEPLLLKKGSGSLRVSSTNILLPMTMLRQKKTNGPAVLAVPAQ